MMIRLAVASTLLTFMAAGAGAQDVRDVLEAVAENIGADDLRTLEFSATSGWFGAPGGSHSPFDDWPRTEVTYYERQIDFEAGYMREILTREQGDYPRVGSSRGLPAGGTHTLDVALNGDVAWMIEGGGAGPLDREGYMDGISIPELRKLEILLTPHGFIKAALEPGANPTMIKSFPRGVSMTYVEFMALGKYRLTADINDQNEIIHIQTRVANPMFGDMLYEYRYGNYEQFGSVKYPTYVHHHQGDELVNRGHNVLDVAVSAARANGPIELLTPPDGADELPIDLATIETQEIADGVWYIGGIRHASVVVEFEDFMAVIEAPLNEKRAIAVIEEVYRLAPGKPIEYLVNTHHHFDHAGGVRTFAAEGATLVTHRDNYEYFRDMVLSTAPRILEPDRYSVFYPDRLRNAIIERVNRKFVISDGARSLDVYSVLPFPHVTAMVIAYLPEEGIVVNADMYRPPDRGADPPAANSSMRALMQTIEDNELEVDQHVFLHGGIGPHSDFVSILGAD
jgi:glyoxylase-like metal-dependent hydrolase (beta-lactamase superfamily II)